MIYPAADVRHVSDLLAQGLTSSEAAEATGISHRTVAKWRQQGIDGLVQRRSDRGHRRRACNDGEECPLLTCLEGPPYAYLLGFYLGDGSIVRVGRTFRLEIVSDAKYPGVLDECAAAMTSVLPNRVGRRRRTGCWVMTSYSNHWPCLLPQHGTGRKHLRSIRLQPWQSTIVDDHPDRFVRGLIHSDGCRVINRVTARSSIGIRKEYRYVRYFFSNRSSDIREFFVAACGRLGVSCRPDGPYDISVARQSSVAILEKIIGPKR